MKRNINCKVLSMILQNVFVIALTHCRIIERRSLTLLPV